MITRRALLTGGASSLALASLGSGALAYAPEECWAAPVKERVVKPEKAASVTRPSCAKPPCSVSSCARVNTIGLRADADHAVHWTGVSIKTAASHIANASEMLSHIECRWAIRT